MAKELYKMAPEAVMRLVQAGMTVLDLDNVAKKQNPLEGMSTKGRNELAASIVEGNNYLSSVREILDEVSQSQAGEESEISRFVSADGQALGTAETEKPKLQCTV